jgi:hypothetical protein
MTAQAKPCATPGCEQPRLEGSNFCATHTKGASPRAKSGSSKGVGVGALLIIAVPVVIGVAMCGGGESKSNGPDKYDVQVTCKEIVRKQLKNPSTADFDGEQQSAVSASGMVVAENALGGKVTYNYRCSVSGDTVTLDSLTPL